MGNGTTEYVYGVNPAFELIRGSRRRAYKLFINQSAVEAPRLKKLADFARRENIPVQSVEKGRLFDMCRSHDHQGAVVETEAYPYAELDGIWEEKRLLLLDNIEDPHNLGAILRTAEVLGFRAVCLPTKGVPGVYPSVVKVSAGATEHLQIVRQRNANQYARKAAESGYRIFALDAKGKLDLPDLAAQKPERYMLVVGGEDKSVGQFILNMADHIVAIPQAGKVGSLNASVSAAIAMYALT